jgi:hypothetical protein
MDPLLFAPLGLQLGLQLLKSESHAKGAPGARVRVLSILQDEGARSTLQPWPIPLLSLCSDTWPRR